MELQDILVYVVIAVALIYAAVRIFRTLRRVDRGGDRCSGCNCNGDCDSGESCDK